MNVEEIEYRVADTDENDLRNDEKQYYNVQGDSEDDIKAYAIFDKRPETYLNAILGIARTIFVTIVLASGALLFSKDA